MALWKNVTGTAHLTEQFFGGMPYHLEKLAFVSELERKNRLPFVLKIEKCQMPRVVQYFSPDIYQEFSFSRVGY